ncbi:MAG: hypothetical protein FVQ84_22815 [Planctomycetes bacterium]|nr:hypothetical protein [Planctomycetota bacterium]
MTINVTSEVAGRRKYKKSFDNNYPACPSQGERYLINIFYLLLLVLGMVFEGVLTCAADRGSQARGKTKPVLPFSRLSKSMPYLRGGYLLRVFFSQAIYTHAPTPDSPLRSLAAFLVLSNLEVS